MEMGHTREADTINNVQITVLEAVGAGTGSIGAGEVTNELASETAAEARDRLVRVSPDAASCCIDGRCAKCTMAEGEAAHTEPRPSVAGGADVTGYAAAELAGYFAPDDMRPSGEKLTDIDSKFRSQGLNPGSHCDEKAVANAFEDPANPELSKTGCGAADKLIAIVNKFYDSPEPIARYTQALLGETYNADLLSLPARESIDTRLEKWDSRDVVEVTSSVSAGKNVEVLMAEHQEMLVIFNFVEGTTVDRDALVQETGKQVFVVDMWYIDKMAAALAAGRDDANEMEAKLRHFMVGYQIATYLELCDGTQRPVIFTEDTLA